jgi:ribosomal biogenesis protein LAS1
METTFALAQVAWRDATANGALSSMELRMAYSTAILRGVNGLADALQQNRAYAASVASLCEQMGLPGWLVDIRHEAAHNDLPSLSVLRLATKTFLGYLEERYWVPLAKSRHEARETAAHLLVKYKEECKKNTATGVKEKEIDTNNLSESSSSDKDSELDDDNDDVWGKSVGTNQNRFAAFLETSEPIKAKKKRKKDTLKKNDKEVYADSKKAVHTALHYARVFVRDVPIDVGYQVALSFLVWGGMGEAPNGRGVLIPGSPASFPESEECIQRIRHRYKPLLLVLCKAWPGFAQALLVHLVNHVISIESSAGDQLNAGSERKLYFLASWIRFLLSREFHSHHDKSVALCGKQDLCQKCSVKWTKTERDFMESPAPYSVLSRAGLPLNSLCDRCLGAGQPGIKNGSHALGVIFSGILGGHKVSNFGVPISNDDAQSQWPEEDTKETTTPSVLSLDDLGQMVACDANQEGAEGSTQASNAVEGETSVPSKIVNSAWSRCTTWDACAIGSLPGRPV